MTHLPPLIPRHILFGNPGHIETRLSPSGRQLSYIAPVSDAHHIWVGGTGDHDFRPLTRGRRGIRFYEWAHDDRHLLYLQDNYGDERTHVYIVELATGDVRDLTPFGGIQAQLPLLSRDVPGEALVGLNRRDPSIHDIFRVSLDTGVLSEVAENPGNVIEWLCDRHLRVRGAVARDPDGTSTILVRDHEQDTWRELYTVPPEDRDALRPLSFTAAGDGLLILSSRDAQAARLLRVDLADGSVQVLYEDPDGYDVTDVSLHPLTGEPRLAAVQRERTDLEVLDESIRREVTRLRSACENADLALAGCDRDDRTWLVEAVRDDRPPTYYLYDRGTGQADFLFSHLPKLSGYQLARMQPFSFAARDGTLLHGYLSFPPGAEGQTLPTVLTVHGGPWVRDTWGFRTEPQWLANRGYLCASVNYRGSAGYGKDFLNAGDREWGGRMQDDLTDTVRWLIGHRFADPSRIAIYGGSYGGYAALAGAAFTPDLFRCAVVLAGPSNLRTMLRSEPSSRDPAIRELHRRVGHPVADADFLWSRSPLSQAHRIRIPLLVVQGANDPRVRREESDQVVAALTARGVPPQYLLFPDEGHGLLRPSNRLALRIAAERFLAQHLGGRCEDAPRQAAEGVA